MSQQPLEMVMESFGISPWELEVAYGYFNSRFVIKQEVIEESDPDFVSVLNIDIPLAFSEDFFDWFEFKRWEKIKALFKEMKRRRGSKKALKIQINFAGNPTISFIIDARDKQLYDNSVEKIDFVLELLPYHLDPEKLPENVTHVLYRYDEKARRWRFSEAFVNDSKFAFKDDGWKKII